MPYTMNRTTLGPKIGYKIHIHSLTISMVMNFLKNLELLEFSPAPNALSSGPHELTKIIQGASSLHHMMKYYCQLVYIHDSQQQ